MDESAYWTAVGAIAVAFIGIVGNKLAKSREEKQREREITTATNVELERAHESRPWAEMGRRITDLKEEIERLERAIHDERADNDRLREEREKLRVEVADWQIEARKAAGALARITDLQQQCEQERRVHAEEVSKLKAEIARLQRGGRR